MECDICGIEFVDDSLRVRRALPDEKGYNSDGFEQDFGHGKVVVCPFCYHRNQYALDERLERGTDGRLYNVFVLEKSGEEVDTETAKIYSGSAIRNDENAIRRLLGRWGLGIDDIYHNRTAYKPHIRWETKKPERVI